ADLRLTPVGRELGLVDDARWARFDAKREAIARETGRLGGLWASPGNAAGREAVEKPGVELTRENSALDLLRRPEMDYAKLWSLPGFAADEQVAAEVAWQIEIETECSGDLQRQREESARQQRLESTPTPQGFDYAAVRGLSAEVQQKLERVRPLPVGQARR